MRVSIIELFKVNVASVNTDSGKEVMSKKVFAFSDHMKAYEWLLQLPMDSSHIDYYFRATYSNLDSPEVDTEQPFSSMSYAKYNELNDARRIKDLHFVMKGLAR